MVCRSLMLSRIVCCQEIPDVKSVVQIHGEKTKSGLIIKRSTESNAGEVYVKMGFF